MERDFFSLVTLVLDQCPLSNEDSWEDARVKELWQKIGAKVKAALPAIREEEHAYDQYEQVINVVLDEMKATEKKLRENITNLMRCDEARRSDRHVAEREMTVIFTMLFDLVSAWDSSVGDLPFPDRSFFVKPKD